MNNVIIRNHNARVKKDDLFFFIGDFCFKNGIKGKEGEGIGISAKEWESKLNGKLIFVQGNHDKSNSCKTPIQGILIKLGGKKIYLVHKPEHVNFDYELNLVGHEHEKFKIKRINEFVDDNLYCGVRRSTIAYNVGVDVNNFMPITINEIFKNINRWKHGRNT